MRQEVVLTFIKRQPFRPFRLTLSDGRTYDIHHPEMVSSDRSAVFLELPETSSHNGVKVDEEPSVTISLLHIMQIRPLKTSPTSNA